MFPKQVIVVRKDLNMRKGKIAVQCSHASMKVLLDLGKVEGHTLTIPHLTPEMVVWLTGRFTKVVVSVDSEEELMEIQRRADQKGLPSALIIDSGATEFNGVPTATCVAVGPAHPDAFIGVTDHLKLM